ncbi:glycosyltransferase family 2 protein [Tropicimonas marinistellae]|uniref:glycosyltransferase family 2 protein n=1 Tax=Tropicimonas marinistellae TaxID=1739787 RepID=UPI00082A1722|nr:glycosyltransferase family 2 protein [Tropicimonas marinistellae]
MLLGIETAGGSHWDCKLEFDRFDYANVAFFDEAGQDILLHLSFRAAENLLVLNRRANRVWEEEAHIACDFSATGSDLRIEFADEGATIFLDDSPLLSWLSHPSKGQVRWFDLYGGVRDVRIHGASGQGRHVHGELKHTPAFALAGWGVEAGNDTQVIRIESVSSPCELPQRYVTRHDIADAAGCQNTSLGVVAILPATMWQDVPDGDTASFQLTCNGRPCADPVMFDRDALVDTIGAIAADEEATAFALISSIEHATHAGVVSRLSATARKRLAQAVGTYGLWDIPAAGEFADAQGAAVPEPIESDVDVMKVEAVQRAFGSQLRSEPCRSPADVLQDPQIRSAIARLTTTQQRLLALRLTDTFAEADDMEALAEIATTCALREEPAPDAAWARSFRLPYDLLAEDGDAVVGFFRWLEERPDDWVSRTSIAWAIKQIVTACPLCLDDSDREAAVRTYVEFVTWQARDYWQAPSCLNTLDAFVTVLSHLDRFSTNFQEWAIDRAWRLFWLSPTFWRRWDTDSGLTALHTDPRLNAARRAFDAATTIVLEGPDATSATPMTVAGTPDGERLVRELAATGWTGDDSAMMAVRQTHDLLLRRAALPGQNSPIAENQAELVAEAIRRHTPDILHNEYHHVQTRVGARVAALLEAPSEAPYAERLRGLQADLHLLAGRRSNFIGIAIALNLTSALLRCERNDDADITGTFACALIEAVQENDAEALTVSPAVRMAVFGLRQTAQVCVSDLAQRIVNILPAAEAEVPEPAKADTESRLPRDARSTFFDTVVIVFSCRALLDSRVAAQRETWLRDLKARGIPYLIAVGDGDGTVEGDVVYLDAPDSYEGLPRKVLAAVRWVYENTPFSHMLKIDDDCFLDVDRFFFGQSYRKFAYYGRGIQRLVGQTDRVWHVSRSGNDASAPEIDKSPEPSTYTDGGTGYVLNRTIMQILLRNSETEEGAQLILTSIMEDKLIGDLLWMTGILPDSEDYDSCVLRRPHSAGVPISRWMNAFLPGPASPAKIAHLDAAALQAKAAEHHSSGKLFPRKVWPTVAPAFVGWNHNALSLVGTEERLQKTNEQELVVISAARNEREMLPLFLRHYRTLGVKGFLIADNCSDDGSLEYLHEQPDVAVFSVDSDYANSEYGVAWQQALMANFRLNRWSLVADVDEFLVLANGETSLPEVVSSGALGNADAARVFMLDLYPAGPLAEANFDDSDPFAVATHVDREPFRAETAFSGPFSNARTWTSNLRHRLLANSRPDLFVAQKYALLRYRPWMRLTAGLHFLAEAEVAQREFIFAHFKYHAGFHEKIRREIRRKQHFNNAEEYRRYRDLMSEGQDVLFDPDVSVPWRECEWVRERLR